MLAHNGVVRGARMSADLSPLGLSFAVDTRELRQMSNPVRNGMLFEGLGILLDILYSNRPWKGESC